MDWTHELLGYALALATLGVGWVGVRYAPRFRCLDCRCWLGGEHHYDCQMNWD